MQPYSRKEEEAEEDIYLAQIVDNGMTVAGSLATFKSSQRLTCLIRLLSPNVVKIDRHTRVPLKLRLTTTMRFIN